MEKRRVGCGEYLVSNSTIQTIVKTGPKLLVHLTKTNKESNLKA
jgi:hypothetical protein